MPHARAVTTSLPLLLIPLLSAAVGAAASAPVAAIPVSAVARPAVPASAMPILGELRSATSDTARSRLLIMLDFGLGSGTLTLTTAPQAESRRA